MVSVQFINLRNISFILCFSIVIWCHHIWFRNTRIQRDQTVRIKDCSSKRQIAKKNYTPFWTESKNFMNVSSRAKAAIDFLQTNGYLNDDTGLIVDIGAGFHAVGKALPEFARSKYAPVDIIQRVEGSRTSICNLNEGQFPFFHGQKVTAFLFLGSFEYFLDKVTLLRLCRMKQAVVILQYQVNMLVNQNKYSWVAPFSIPSFMEVSKIIGYEMSAHKCGAVEPLDLNDPKTANHRGCTFIYLRPV